MIQISAVRIAFDLVVLVVLVAAAVVFKTVVTPAHSGFFCNDLTLFLPYRDSTISPLLLQFLTFILPIILITIIEVCNWLISKDADGVEEHQVGNTKVHRLIVLLYYFLGFFIIGSLINRIICDIAKYTTGQLRPNFISVCHPNTNLSDCKAPNYYIETYNCTNTDEHQVSDVHLSFCSGHTAYSFYAATYFYFYLERRLRNRYTSGAFLPCVHCGVFSLVIYIASTRLKDHKHHLSNVCFGGVLGFIVGYVVAVKFAKIPNYYRETVVKKDDCSVAADKNSNTIINPPTVPNSFEGMRFRGNRVSVYRRYGSSLGKQYNSSIY